MKTFSIKDGDISDGYHTFDELYKHRNFLFLALVKACGGNSSYFVPYHFPDWDLIVWETTDGQISYHIHSKFRPGYQDWLNEKTEAEHVFDGHTSQDVLCRLWRRITPVAGPLD